MHDLCSNLARNVVLMSRGYNYGYILLRFAAADRHSHISLRSKDKVALHRAYRDRQQGGNARDERRRLPLQFLAVLTGYRKMELAK